MTVDEKILQEQRLNVGDILSTKAGRSFIWRILSHCGVYRDINTDEEMSTSRALGQRSVGLWLLQVIGDVDEDKLFEMMKEAKVKAKEIELLLENEEKQNKIEDNNFDIESFIS